MDHYLFHSAIVGSKMDGGLQEPPGRMAAALIAWRGWEYISIYALWYLFRKKIRG